MIKFFVVRNIFIIITLLFFSSHLFAQVSFTSVQSGNWNDGATWGNASPGTIGIDFPDNNGDDNVTILNGHTVILQSNSTISNFTINVGGIFDYNNFTLNPGGTISPFISNQSGNFSNNSTWLNGSAPGTTARAIVVKGHTVNVGDDQIKDLQVDAGAVISTDNNKDLTVTSSLILNGTLKLNQGNADFFLTTGPVSLSGAGIIDGSASSTGALQVNATTTVSSSSDLTLIGDIDVGNSITMTVNGGVRVSSGNVTAGNASSRVTMGSSGVLEVDGTLVTGGILDAVTNPGNTVEYYGNSAQNIKQPLSNTYYNLIISGTSIKTFPASNLTLGGSLTINSGTLDINNRNITIAGDWDNNSAFSNISSVTYNGSGTQYITNPTSGQNFTNVIINKSSGSAIVLNNDVIITAALTMTQGNINTGAFTITLGSGAEGTLNYTAGTIIGTFGRYIASTTITAFAYPIGTANYLRTISVTFDQTGSGRSAGIVYGSFTGTDPGTNGLPLTDDIVLYNPFNEGYWNFSVSGFSKGNSNTFDLALTGNGFTSFPIDANTRIITRSNSAAAWTTSGAHNSVSVNTVSRDNISSFPGQFAFGDDTNCSRPADPAITGAAEVCRNDNNQAYSVTLNSGNSYNWTVVGGTIDEAGGATTTGYVLNQNAITVDWGNTGLVGSVSVTEKNSCTSSNTVNKSVNINSIPPSGLTGKVYAAAGSTGVAYSVTNATNTTYTWTISGGTKASGGSTNAITVNWGSAGSGSVSVTATKTTPSCGASTASTMNVNIYNVVESNGSGGGNWGTGSTWVTGSIPLTYESARIKSGDVVTLSGGGGEDIYTVIVNGILNVNSRDIRINGDLIINSGGQVTGTSGTVQLSGTASSPQNQIDGTGSINGGFTIEVKNGNKQVASTAVITQSGTGTIFNIDAGLTVTNNGSIQIGGNMTGDNASSTWTNAANSTLIVGNNLLATGILKASATGNTVRYDGSTTVNIKQPSTFYQNLSIQTSSTKTATAPLDINGNLTLTSGTLSIGANNLNLAGNLTYTAGNISSTTAIITMDGSVNQVVTGSTSIPRLTINNTASGNAVTFSNNFTVSNTLTLTDGILNTGSNVLTISNTATGGVSGGSSASYINGNLARQTNSTGIYDFPVGTSTTYKRIGIVPAATGGSTYRVQAFKSAYSDITNLGSGLNNVSELEYWNIQRTAGSDAAQVRLYWNTESSSSITLASDLRVANYTGGQWVDQGNGSNSGDVDPGYVQSSTAISTFGPVTFGSASGSENPLPVELLSFTGKVEGRKIILEWVTVTEIDNDYFSIERSSNANDFNSIGEVGGFGTSKETHDYSFVDDYPLQPISYYRLKQVDFNGDFIFSPIIYVNYHTDQAKFRLFPNPVSEATQIYLDIAAGEKIKSSIVSMAGESVFTFQGSLTELNQTLGTSFTRQKAGVYLFIIESKSGTFKQKVIKN